MFRRPFWPSIEFQRAGPYYDAASSMYVQDRTLQAHLNRKLARHFADDPLVGSIAQQYIKDRATHDKTAADWTRRYAE